MPSDPPWPAEPGSCLCCVDVLGDDGDDILGLCARCASGRCPYCGGSESPPPRPRRPAAGTVVTVPGLLTDPPPCPDGRRCPCPSWCWQHPCLLGVLAESGTRRLCALCHIGLPPGFAGPILDPDARDGAAPADNWICLDRHGCDLRTIAYLDMAMAGRFGVTASAVFGDLVRTAEPLELEA